MPSTNQTLLLLLSLRSGTDVAAVAVRPPSAEPTLLLPILLRLMLLLRGGRACALRVVPRRRGRLPMVRICLTNARAADLRGWITSFSLFLLSCPSPPLSSAPVCLQIFEIPATGTLLLLNAGMSDIIRPLGFVPHVHYVPYTADDVDAVADAVLDPANRAAMDAIRRQGQELVLARHTSTHRAAEIDVLAETWRGFSASSSA